MRPQKLTLKNFMPFRAASGEVHEVDFSNLDLFAITGPMASGKSSLIDAIVWCLYGRTARYGADSKGVVSAGETLCEVSFEFTVGDRRFCAVRRTGKNTESGLTELGEELITDVSGAERLTQRIEELLGLDFDGFTKTVILPQGKYAEFLSSRPNDRRELLETILELGVYKRIANRAKEVAGHSEARAKTLRETLSQYAGVTRERIEQHRQELVMLEQQLAETAGREAVFQRLMQSVDGLTTLIRREAELRTTEQTRTSEKTKAAQVLTEAEVQLQSLGQKLVELSTARDALGYDAARHEVLRRTVSHLREYLTARHEAERKQQELVLLQKDIDVLTHRLASKEQEVTATQQEHHVHTSALQAETAQSGDIAELTEKLSQAKRWKELQHQHQGLLQQQQRQNEKLLQVQQSLTSHLQQEETKDQELRVLLQQREQLREEEQAQARLEDEAKALGKELQEAVREEKRLTKECEDARAAVLMAEQELQKQQSALTRAEQQEQEALRMLEETRRQYEVEHLRASLHIGDACPVCETQVQRVPDISELAMGDLAALQRSVEITKVSAQSVRQVLQKAHATVAAVTSKKESAEQELTVREQKRHEIQERFVGRFPGYASLATALSGVQQQRQALATAVKEAEAKAQTTEREKVTLTRQREQEQKEEATLQEAIRSLIAQLETHKAQIAELAQALAAFIKAGDDPEAILTTRRQRLVQLEQHVKTAEQQQRTLESALATEKTNKVQKEGTAGILASQREAAEQRAQREAQAVRDNLNLPSDLALPELATLDGELTGLTQKQQQHTAFLQQEKTLQDEQGKQDRLVTGLRADLQARERALAETQQAVTKCEQELTQARQDLQKEVQKAELSDIGEDGQGLKEQLANVHAQGIAIRERRSRLEAEVNELERRCTEKEQEEDKLRAADTEGRLATDLHKLLGSEFTDFLSQEAVEALMRDATLHLQRLTHGRYSFNIAPKRRAIELLIVDHEDNKRERPTHSLSGGETFLASLAIALALSQGFRELATGKAARTSTECLILDEGFGTLDREGIQLVTETLQELRGEEGRMVGIITHVEEVAAAMPMRIEVKKGSRSSVIAVTG